MVVKNVLRAVPVCLTVGLLAAACGGGEEQTAGTLVRADVPRAAAPAAAAATASDTVNRVGLGLYGIEVAGNPDGNIVISPYSIAMALAMARVGAAGTTADEMDAVLGVTDPAGLHPAMNALDEAVTSRSGPKPLADGATADVTLTTANSLWVQQDRTYVAAFLETLAAQYGAGLRLVDYIADPEAARLAINRWVDGETQGRIPDLLTPGSIDTLTRLTLVNAIYLKAPWLFPFAEDGTQPGPFTKVDGSVVDVPLMALTEALAYTESDGWQAVELPYLGNELAMLVLVPDAGTLDTFEAGLTPERLDGIAAALQTQQVRLRLPSWDTEQRLSLRTALANLGMPTAFTDAADFSGMTTDEPLQIADVVHQANITVDEEGTEAAAATAVVVRAPSAPPDPVELTVDRPFVFALRDQTTGAVLFLGRVADPTA
jgi:serine protease inhibitor